jgi:Peptidase propeptide and YPEB domain
MFRRIFLIGLVIASFALAAAPAFADSGSGGGGTNSGSGGGGNSGPDGGGDDHHGGDDDNDRGGDDWNRAADAASRGEIAPLHFILKIALSNTPGKLIDVKLQRRGASYTYRVKILAATGRKIELIIDARTQNITRFK